jgi:hypothetical protein
MHKTDLTTLPSFIYYQGELLSDTDAEFPIQITYYQDEIIGLQMLDQSGREIVIRARDLKSLFKEIERHLLEAQKKLKGK